MEKKNKWKLMILPASLFLLAFGLYAGYTMWEQGNLQGAKGKSDSSNLKNGGQTVAVFQEESEHEKYSTVGSFIREFHTKYNDTLGWGGIDSIEWEEQREIASEIISVLATVETDNTALQTDFNTILNYSKTIEDGKKDKKILLQLHRYFHDLDIEFNSYNKTSDYFNVTKYKDPGNG